MIDIYPLTIIRDRYGGTYSGGKYTAWNVKHYEIPKRIDGDDMDCQKAWQDLRNVKYPVGIGETIQEAIKDLERLLQ